MGDSLIKQLTDSDITAAALDLGVEEATIQAIIEVESNGKGFLLSGKPKILFEGHVFWKRLKAHGFNPENYIEGNRDILYPNWSEEHYLGGEGEYDRLEKASKLHLYAALESASWGLFQIMGYWWRKLGYLGIKQFVDRMNENEREHLNAFIRYVKVNHQVNYLRDRQWDKFAFHYNGSSYAENHYDTKLAKAYKKFGGKYDAETHT